MKCDNYRDLISRHMDDGLSLREQSLMMSHLAVCPDCALALARYRQMDVRLGRLRSVQLPSSVPPPIRGFRRGGFSFRQLAAATLAILLSVLGGALLVGTSARTQLSALVTDTSRPGIRTEVSSGHAPLESSALTSKETSALASQEIAVAKEDAMVLQQIRRTVHRPGFRPLLPGYLPKGARLNTVDLGRGGLSGPIDRLEVAYAAGDLQIRLRQLSGEAAATERQRVEALPEAQRSRRTVNGREWQFIPQRPADRMRPTTYTLIGQVDGMTISLEAALPVDELEKVIASLQD